MWVGFHKVKKMKSKLQKLTKLTVSETSLNNFTMDPLVYTDVQKEFIAKVSKSVDGLYYRFSGLW